jgi:hypothetical protein
VVDLGVAHGSGLETVGGKVMKFGFLIGLFPAVVGVLWLAADWLDL